MLSTAEADKVRNLIFRCAGPWGRRYVSARNEEHSIPSQVRTPSVVPVV